MCEKICPYCGRKVESNKCTSINCSGEYNMSMGMWTHDIYPSLIPKKGTMTITCKGNNGENDKYNFSSNSI